MTAPIPKAALIHSCVLKKQAQTGAWGEKQRTVINISSVRFEPVNQRTWAVGTSLTEVTAKMYYDCVNSAPHNVAFDTDDTVVFEGNEYSVAKVQQLYDDRGLHHLEVLLR